MTPKLEHTLDKNGWEPGPWIDEPDQGAWLDEATNYPCLIVRDDHTGTLNGYVGVGQDHPAFRKHFRNIAGMLAYSGRELTFSGAGNGLIGWPEHPRHIEVWWFGYDNSHAMQRRNFTKEARALYDMIDQQRTTAIPESVRRAVRGGEGHYTTWKECEAYCAQLARALKEMADG